MTIITIHILEALVVLLIGLKLIRIRSLYKNSLLPASPKQKVHTRSKTVTSKTSPHKLAKLSQKADSNLFLTTLPEPEVLFASNHEESSPSETAENREDKSILNSYIDDFFYESPKFNFEEKPISTKKEVAPENTKEDEFITVQEENANLVRALEALKRDAGISAQY